MQADCGLLSVLQQTLSMCRLGIPQPSKQGTHISAVAVRITLQTSLPRPCSRLGLMGGGTFAATKALHWGSSDVHSTQAVGVVCTTSQHNAMDACSLQAATHQQAPGHTGIQRGLCGVGTAFAPAVAPVCSHKCSSISAVAQQQHQSPLHTDSYTCTRFNKPMVAF